MISARDLTKSYGRRRILDGLSLTAHAGEVTLLVGSNGAGKTTTLRILAGAARPDGGAAEIGGADIVRKRRDAQRRLSFLPQAVTFDPRLTCRELLRFYCRLRGVALARVPEFLESAGLENDAKKRAGELSGGLRQRLGLAVLLLPDAPVLMLDEPGLSLDPGWRARLRETLRSQAAAGKTVLVATHLLGEWEGAADRCLRCEDGKITGEIDPNRLREEGLA
jgi:ABC-type multidrug transport system ATPase subunit